MKAIQLDPADTTNKTDLAKVEEVTNFERVVKRSAEKGDYETAVKYLDNVIAECPHSLEHPLLKVEYLVRGYKLKDAQDYSAKVVQMKQYSNNA